MSRYKKKILHKEDILYTRKYEISSMFPCFRLFVRKFQFRVTCMWKMSFVLFMFCLLVLYVKNVVDVPVISLVECFILLGLIYIFFLEYHRQRTRRAVYFKPCQSFWNTLYSEYLRLNYYTWFEEADNYLMTHIYTLSNVMRVFFL